MLLLLKLIQCLVVQNGAVAAVADLLHDRFRGGNVSYAIGVGERWLGLSLRLWLLELSCRCLVNLIHITVASLQ